MCKSELLVYENYNNRVYRISVHDMYLKEKKDDLLFAMIEEMARKIRNDISCNCHYHSHSKSEEIISFLSFLSNNPVIFASSKNIHIRFKGSKPKFYSTSEKNGLMFRIKERIIKLMGFMVHKPKEMATRNKK